MESPRSMRLRAAHFINDRDARREQPIFPCELVAFGVVLVTAAWPILLLTGAMALTLR